MSREHFSAPFIDSQSFQHCSVDVAVKDLLVFARARSLLLVAGDLRQEEVLRVSARHRRASGVREGLQSSVSRREEEGGSRVRTRNRLLVTEFSPRCSVCPEPTAPSIFRSSSSSCGRPDSSSSRVSGRPDVRQDRCVPEVSRSVTAGVFQVCLQSAGCSTCWRVCATSADTLSRHSDGETKQRHLSH